MPLCVSTPFRLAPPAPWITPEVTEAKAERMRSEGQWKKTGLTVHKDIYRAHRRNCVQLMRERKKDHTNESLTSAGSKELFKVSAFDTLDHDILLSRLSCTYGIRGSALKWFHSYITNRHQKVVTAQDESEKLRLKFGVPQGSVLGPILFSLYSAPLRDVLVKHGFQFHFYADDTQLYKSVDACEVPSLFESLQKCVCNVSKRMNANKLKLNHDETEVIVIGTPAKVSAIKTRSVELCGELINITSSVRNLGAHLDSNLTMNQHILQLRKTCYLELRRIAQIQQYLTVESANRLVCSTINSRLDYCNSLLAGLPEVTLKKLQQVQNNAARLVTKTRKRDHITPVLKSLHWLPIHLRVDYKIATFVHQCLYDPSFPVYMKELVTPYTPNRALRSSAKMLIQNPRFKLKIFGQRALPSQAAVIWNDLPLEY
ncbi:reverse transcriptase [Elysia marginata]|uniref:Reverse transcriptase n=1 Tax=Elysia marginata TaxID=1093978 RepID=A0AAV4FLA0_9GAST|nr:reverse transcriptase [Elysia marginata]